MSTIIKHSYCLESTWLDARQLWMLDDHLECDRMWKHWQNSKQCNTKALYMSSAGTVRSHLVCKHFSRQNEDTS